MSVADTIRKLRKSRGLTQAELGQKIGARQKVIADYENGISKPPRDRLLALAKFFNTSVEKMLGDDGAITLPQSEPLQKIHGNKRAAKLLKAFEQLSPVEQRVLLKQTAALAEQKNGNGR